MDYGDKLGYFGIGIFGRSTYEGAMSDEAVNGLVVSRSVF